jgi:3-dehydroquinate synthetase
MTAGYAEIVKYSLIFDIKFFNWLIINGKRVMNKNKEALTHAIFQSCQCKSKIVSLDEKEKNIRALLNFGHTFGHVIEQTNSYKTNINHGEAVAMGMIMASKLSSAMNLISINELNKIINHFKLLNLPTQIPRSLRKNLSIKKFIDVMNKDKKTKNNKINLILLKKIGKAYQTNKFDSRLLKIIIKDSIT